MTDQDNNRRALDKAIGPDYDAGRYAIINEARRAAYNDSGQENVTTNINPNDNIVSYRVDEERRIILNDSLQAVGVSYDSDINHLRAYLVSKTNGETAQLTAGNDGELRLNISGEDGSTLFEKILTREEAASAGLSFAGVRRTQQDIAADGEVSRPEQQQIIDMIDKAKTAVGLRTQQR